MTEPAPRKPRFEPRGVFAVDLVRYPQASPVFIVGSARSGTSAAMDALRDGAGIPGFNEGVLAQLMPVLLSSVDRHYSTFLQKHSTMLGSIGKDVLSNGIKNLFGKAFIETMGEGRWLDKTPGGAVAACPALLEIFPNARFIFCKRRGIENVLSRQSKFPDQPFDLHCTGWAAAMEAWLEVGPRLGAHAIALDQRDMAVEPERVSAELATFLGLTAEQRAGVLNAFQNKRLQQTRPARDDVPVRIEDTGWTATERETFQAVCGPMMKAFGYAEGEDVATRTPLSSYQFFVPIADGIAVRENVSDRKACRALDAKRFKIHPNPFGSPPAGIRHRMIEMSNFREFSAKIRCLSGDGRATGSLIFSFALERSSDGSPAFLSERTLAPGSREFWRCELPQLAGPHDAILSVRPMSVETDAPTRSLWTDAQLT
jgi:hypothetical protein